MALYLVVECCWVKEAAACLIADSARARTAGQSDAPRGSCLVPIARGWRAASFACVVYTVPCLVVVGFCGAVITVLLYIWHRNSCPGGVA